MLFFAAAALGADGDLDRTGEVKGPVFLLGELRVPQRVEVLRGDDALRPSECILCAVLGEQRDESRVDRLQCVLGDFVALDLEAELLAQEARGALIAEDGSDDGLIGHQLVGVLELDGHFAALRAPGDERSGDFAPAPVHREILVEREDAQFAFLRAETAFEGFEFGGFVEDVPGELGNVTGRVGEDGVSRLGGCRLRGDSADV